MAVLKLRVMLAVKTYLSTRPVSFNTKSEVEVYQLANNARIMLYGEHERLKKRLKTRRLTYLKIQQVHQPSFSRHFSKILELV